MNPCGEEVSATFCTTMVGAPICPPSVVSAGFPSIPIRYLPCAADQVNVKEAAGITAEKKPVATPPVGAGPKRKPTSRATPESGNVLRTLEGFTYSLYGAILLLLRKKAPLSCVGLTLKTFARASSGRNLVS